MPRRQWRQARPPDETDSTTRKKRAQRRRERARAQELEGNDESNGWAPTTKETKKPKKPKGEPRAQPMKQVPIHASARRGRAEEAEGAEGAEGDAESHYTMADSVCAGGTVERTRRTARPRTAGTACSSWPEGVPRDFSLEASKAPVLFHQKWCFLGCLLVLAWGETTNRTMADGREWYSCRTIRCGSGSWQDCGAGLWNRRQAHGVLAVQRQYSFRRQPEVTQRGKGVTTQTCFLPRGRRAQARSVGEGASPCQANLGVFHGRLLRRGVRAKGAGPSGRNKPAGFPLTFCLFVCLFSLHNSQSMDPKEREE